MTTHGKNLMLGGRRFGVRGVTYGSFVSRSDGARFPATERITADFDSMGAAGLNTVRTYTVPPPDVLDAARERELRLIVGVHYLDWRFEATPGAASRKRVLSAGRRAVHDAMELCAGRPEVLAISVGNEVPADVVRVHGIGAVADTLSELGELVHEADREALVTYASRWSCARTTSSGRSRRACGRRRGAGTPGWR